MNSELEGLLARYLADDLDDPGRARLLELCRDDADARRELARLTVTERSLGWLHTRRNAETFTGEVLACLQVESRSGNSFVHGVIERLRQGLPIASARSWLAPLAAAAAIVAMAFWFMDRSTHEAAPGFQSRELVARITGAKDCQWRNQPATLQTGAYLYRGQRLELAKGFVEITFDCGAQVVLAGPASCDLDSAWDATLHYGTLKATVPPQAIGFRIANPAVEVVDLGTEFTMVADAGGATEVLVLKGAVEAMSARDHANEALVLREKEARRFASSGVSELTDREQVFARFAQPVTLEREVQAASYVHWSFDEAAGDLLKADAIGLPPGAFDARLENMASTAHTEGRWRGALSFDGAMFARASFPGISANTPRTVLFWAKVPEDAQLSDAYAMAAWRANSEKLGSRAVHIGWNRNPSEGAIGALRTDFSRGFAGGTTPLRDSQWHHIAVVFVPGDRLEDPVQVKQYVDGRLEGSARKPPKRDSGSTALNEESATSASDVLWLGCRLGSDGPRKERFRGQLDELFIANRALTPKEIVNVMTENQPLDASINTK